MKLHYIFTEYKKNLPKIITPYFPGFTILNGLGYYKNKPEKSAVIVIITDEFSSNKIVSLISDIKKINKQESILYFGLSGVLETM